MTTRPGQKPDQGGAVSGTKEANAWSGTGNASDPTNEPGQYPPAASHSEEGGGGFDYELEIFGTKLPTGTGAGGTRGAHPGTGEDPTTEPGQLNEVFSGEGPEVIANTGAPGMATTPDTEGGNTTITYTRNGAFLSGTYQSDQISVNTYGPQDGTQANAEGYATGGPQLPGLKGNEPQAGQGRYQPGAGRVLRGGRAVKP